MLGIPTVLDRLIQQALLQVLTRLYDPMFSDSSLGFAQAGVRIRVWIAPRTHCIGHRWVVDMAWKSFFDRVNHDILMSRLARQIAQRGFSRWPARELSQPA